MYSRLCPTVMPRLGVYPAVPEFVLVQHEQVVLVAGPQNMIAVHLGTGEICYPSIRQGDMLIIAEFSAHVIEFPPNTMENFWATYRAKDQDAYTLPPEVNVEFDSVHWKVKLPIFPWMRFESLDRPQVVEYEGEYYMFFHNRLGELEVQYF